MCTVESDNAPPLEDPFPRRSGGGPAAHCNIFGVLGVIFTSGQIHYHSLWWDQRSAGQLG